MLGQGGQGAHVVESIGQFDDQDPKVLGHRHEHLAHAGRLLVLPGVEAQPVQFGDPVDDRRHLGAEVALQVLQVDPGVFDGVVE